MSKMTEGMVKLLEEDFEKALRAKAKLKGSKEDLPSLVEFYRKEMGVPESHFPIEQIQSETLQIDGEEAKGSTASFVRPGPLTMGKIKVTKDPTLRLIVHELQHAKEQKGRSGPEYQKEREQRIREEKHFVSSPSETLDPSGLGWELKETLKLEKEIEDLKRVIEGMKKK